jgi:hypothetical protein
VKRIVQTRWLPACAGLLITAIARNAYACAMCGLPPGDSATHAFAVSVLFMLAAPYTVLMVGAVVAFFAYRNGCRRKAAPAQGDPEPQPLSNR